MRSERSTDKGEYKRSKKDLLLDKTREGEGGDAESYD